MAKKTVLFCGGCVKGKCFPKEQGEEVWKHLKGYRKKPGYEDVEFYKAVCLDRCAITGPNVMIINQGVNTPHSLEAKNVEEAKVLLGKLMDEHVIDTTPPSFSKGCCGRGCPECAE